MTVSEKHAEWISLLEVSGSFLAVAVLEEAFPQGLDKVTTPFRQRIRSAYDEWRDAVDESDAQIDAIHREWLILVIRDFLEHDDSILKSGADLPASLQYHDVQSDSTFRPDFAVMAGDKAKLLISVTPPNTDLENSLPSASWLASPAERLIALCRTCGVSVGLVTNGERWMVVSVPADGGSSRASWYARLWFQEAVTLQAFYSLLGVRRCFGQEDQTLEALLQKSLGHQDEITDTLGEQVRRAVEVLVQALDRADIDRNRTLLKDVTPSQLFEAGLTVMMRLVVVLCAEERRLLLLGEPVYDQNYAISTLRSQLVEQASHGLEILERRQDAWSRLLATFRGVYGGISHETLRLPPLGGSLFDPDRFPFLEGREPGSSWKDTPAVPLPIDNRTVLLLLNALQVLEHRSGAQLLSYESLDVEQIGHVYEGLLERTVKRVPEVTVSLEAASSVRKRTGHPELLLSELEEIATTGKAKLETFLTETTGRSKSAITKALAAPLTPLVANRLLAACGGDLKLNERIKTFANLLRTDSWGDPLVYPANAFVVTHGAGRRETGSHYTPKSLTEPVVQHTLEPLAYVGPAEGKARNEWRLKTPIELLSLKICDMAMGSGAFLVQVCRWLADRLVEAWEAEEKAGRAISIEGDVLNEAGDAELMPRDQAERLLIARRLVANRCLYGVDIIPMAVELAKLSLWLVTMMRNRPFSFLDHALKCGDSLLGVSQLKQLEHFSLRDTDHAQPLLELRDLPEHIAQAAALRSELEAKPSHTSAQISEQVYLHNEAEALLSKLRAAGDFLVAAELACPTSQGWDTRRAIAASQMQSAWKKEGAEFQHLARIELNGRRPFHWPLEFPEVFAHGGFDAFVGNPPFLGGRRISYRLGEKYYAGLQSLFPWGFRTTDLCVYFLRRACALIKARSVVGLILSDIITQGDSRDAGIAFLCANGYKIICGRSSRHWPGTAGVKIVDCHMFKGDWTSRSLFDTLQVDAINSQFRPETERSDPFPLDENKDVSFSGHYLGGQGFLVTHEEADCLIHQNESNREVIFDYIKGNELNNTAEQKLAWKAINFGFRDLPEIESRFPEALEIVRQRVKPERDLVKRDVHRERWWRYADARPNLARATKHIDRVLLQPYTAKYIMPSFYDSRCVFAHPIVVIPDASHARYASLQSTLHTIWVWSYCATNLDLISYTANRVLETFPFPVFTDALTEVGRRYSECRNGLRLGLPLDLTEIYNRFHDRGTQSAEVVRLRTLHVELDQAMIAAYGWFDLDLSHGFHPTKQGVRYTISESARRTVLDRLLALNHHRHTEEVTAGLQDKKGGKKKLAAARPQEPELVFEFVKPAHGNPKGSGSKVSRSSAEVQQTELLNAIFICAARREVSDRDDLARQIAETLGFQRLTANLREVIASGINSAIRRGLVTYDAQNIHRVAASYAELDHEFLVKAINASIRPGCVYTPEEVLHLAADYLGCKRLKEAFRVCLESALNAASRRGVLTNRAGEIRKA